MERRLFW